MVVICGFNVIEVLKVYSDIDLLFIDIIMFGGMNGWELVDLVKVIYLKFKVLFIFGYIENVIIYYGCFDLGVDLLSKFYNCLELVIKVWWVLDKDLNFIILY